MPGKMLLHWSPRSPYVRKVMIAAHEMGLAGPHRDHAHGGRRHHTAPRPDAAEPAGENPHAGAGERHGPVRFAGDHRIPGYAAHGARNCIPQAAPNAGPRCGAMRLGRACSMPRWPASGERFRPAERQSQPHMDLWQAKLHACVDALEQEADALGDQRLHHRPSGDRRRAVLPGFPLRRPGMAHGHPRLGGMACDASTRGRRYRPICRWMTADASPSERARTARAGIPASAPTAG